MSVYTYTATAFAHWDLHAFTLPICPISTTQKTPNTTGNLTGHDKAGIGSPVIACVVDARRYSPEAITLLGLSMANTTPPLCYFVRGLEEFDYLHCLHTHI